MYSDNPHYYKIRNQNKMLGLTLHTMTSPQCFNKLLTNMPYYLSPAYIAHYMYQSEETYIKRKINLIADDGIQRTNLGKEIHKHHNDITNLQPQKYIKQIKEFLLYYDS
jgi:hypothetical protein